MVSGALAFSLTALQQLLGRKFEAHRTLVRCVARDRFIDRFGNVDIVFSRDVNRSALALADRSVQCAFVEKLDDLLGGECLRELLALEIAPLRLASLAIDGEPFVSRMRQPVFDLDKLLATPWHLVDFSRIVRVLASSNGFTMS